MTGVMTAAQPLAGSLKDPDISVRREAVFALATLYKTAGLRYSDSYPPILRTRIDAADAAARQALAAALKDGDPQVRERAAIAFGRIGEKDEQRSGPRADTLLREAIKDDSIAVRLYAYWALCRLLGPPRAEQQRKSLEAEAVELLTEALEHEDWTVRYKAAHVALSIHDERIVEPLHRALQDQYQPVRLAAVRALGEIENATSVEPLAAALADEDAAVRYRAAEALAAIWKSIRKTAWSPIPWKEIGTKNSVLPRRPKSDTNSNVNPTGHGWTKQRKSRSCLWRPTSLVCGEMRRHLIAIGSG